MDLNLRKEQFSKAYVHAVASVAGFSVNTPTVDDDSVDLQIAAGGKPPFQSRPRLEAQMKCTERLMGDAEGIRFPVPLKNYDDLRAENLLVPRILIVVVVPTDIGDWLASSEEELALRHCGYWVSLRGLPDSDNTNTVTVTLPRAQIFTTASLIDMMGRIANGGLP